MQFFSHQLWKYQLLRNPKRAPIPSFSFSCPPSGGDVNELQNFQGGGEASGKESGKLAAVASAQLEKQTLSNRKARVLE
jgi:hypothetical protein